MRSRATPTYRVAAFSKPIAEREVSSVPPGPASSESEHVFPVRTHTHTPNAYIYMHTWLATWINADRKHRTHGNTSHRWLHPLPLSGWAGWKAVGTTYEHIQYDMLHQAVHLVAATGSQSLQLLVPGHTNPLGPQPHSSSQYRPPHSRMHTHAQRIPPATGLKRPV